MTLGKVPLNIYQEFRAGHDEGTGHKAKQKKRRPGIAQHQCPGLGKGYVRRVAGVHRRAVIESATTATYLDVKVGQILKLASASQVRDRAADAVLLLTLRGPHQWPPQHLHAEDVSTPM